MCGGCEESSIYELLEDKRINCLLLTSAWPPNENRFPKTMGETGASNFGHKYSNANTPRAKRYIMHLAVGGSEKEVRGGANLQHTYKARYSSKAARPVL